jgi:hypothetical protein
MPDLFPRSKGAVVRIEGATPGQIASIELTGRSTLVGGDANILISAIAVSQQTRIAYFSTLGQALYIYPLGNEMSRAIVSGLALPASVCGDGNRDYTAAEKIINFYNNNKASNFSAVTNPITLSLPPVTLKGFIEGMTLEVSAGALDFGFAKFSITMSIIPKQ